MKGINSMMRSLLKSCRRSGLLLCLTLLFVSAVPHKFYVSKTTILFNDRTRTFEITSKFFTDDFEKVLTQGKDQNLHLGKDNEVLGVNERVEKYFTDHFKLSINDEPIVLRFVGKEVESDLTYCYFEFFRAPQFTTLRVENSLLIDVFPDQQNIVDFTMNSSTNTMIFLKDKTSETIYR